MKPETQALLSRFCASFPRDGLMTIAAFAEWLETQPGPVSCLDCEWVAGERARVDELTRALKAESKRKARAQELYDRIMAREDAPNIPPCAVAKLIDLVLREVEPTTGTAERR